MWRSQGKHPFDPDSFALSRKWYFPGLYQTSCCLLTLSQRHPMAKGLWLLAMAAIFFPPLAYVYVCTWKANGYYAGKLYRRVIWGPRAPVGGALTEGNLCSSILCLLYSKKIPCHGLQFGGCCLHEEDKKSKLFPFLEILGSVLTFWSYWQYSWPYVAKSRSNTVGHTLPKPLRNSEG